jgi:Flp pilus assembly protein TadD
MFKLEKDDARDLAEIGFIAVLRGLHTHAAAIFEGVKVARPAEEAGYIGSALVDLARGQFEAAIAALRGLPPSDAARTFLAMALARYGERDEAREILIEVLSTAKGTPSAGLARSMLDQLDAQPASLLGNR